MIKIDRSNLLFTNFGLTLDTFRMISDRFLAQIRNDTGVHLTRRNALKKAAENFELALEYDANNLEAIYRLAQTRARKARLKEALEKFDALAGNGNYYARGKANAQLDRFQRILRITSSASFKRSTATMKRICSRTACDTQTSRFASIRRCRWIFHTAERRTKSARRKLKSLAESCPN